MKLVYKICMIFILLVMMIIAYRNNLSQKEQITKLQNSLEKSEYE